MPVECKPHCAGKVDKGLVSHDERLAFLVLNTYISTNSSFKHIKQFLPGVYTFKFKSTKC
jgi:hypothetical protein